MSIRWTKRPTELDVAGYAEHLRQGVYLIGDKVALDMEAEAKLNRPWKDDTGAARAGLTGLCIKEPERISIILAHTVEHGIFLELARAGRYAIIWPTIVRNLPVVDQLLKELVR